MRLLIPILLLAATMPVVAQGGAPAATVRAQSVAPAVLVRVCPDHRPFAASAAARDLVVYGRVSRPPRVVVGQPLTLTVEVLDVLKGRLDAAEITVAVGGPRPSHVDATLRSIGPVGTFRAGEEWVLALPGAGTLYLENCGVHAVPVRDGQAVGRIDSMDGNQVVPLDRFRAG